MPKKTEAPQVLDETYPIDTTGEESPVAIIPVAIIPVAIVSCPVCGSTEIHSVNEKHNECYRCYSVFQNNLSSSERSTPVVGDNIEGSTINDITDLPTYLRDSYTALPSGGILTITGAFLCNRNIEQISQVSNNVIPTTEGLFLAAQAAGFTLIDSPTNNVHNFRKV